MLSFGASCTTLVRGSREAPRLSFQLLKLPRGAPLTFEAQAPGALRAPAPGGPGLCVAHGALRGRVFPAALLRRKHAVCGPCGVSRAAGRQPPGRLQGTEASSVAVQSGLQNLELNCMTPVVPLQAMANTHSQEEEEQPSLRIAERGFDPWTFGL